MNNMKETSGQVKVEIQQPLPAQWQEYKALRLRALQSEPQAFASSYERELAYPDEKWQQRLQELGNGISWVFCAKNADEELVGMIGGYRDESDLQNHSAQIWGVYVDNKMRGKGIAKALMRKILEEFDRNLDIESVILEVNSDQEAATKLYESLGFEAETTYSYKMGDGKEHQITRMKRPARSNLIASNVI
jgi:ribosomal protein S18 acetylase RimI-like enzyme